MAIGADGSIRRNRTGRVRIPNRIEPDFFKVSTALKEQFGVRPIVAVQPWGLGRFEILFATEECLRDASEKGFLFNNEKHEIEPFESPVKWLSILNAPFEFELCDFQKFFAPYGEVLSMEFVYPQEIVPWHTGERKIKFRMSKAVPNFVKMGRFTVQVFYSGVVKLCRKCHGNDHLARDCSSIVCRTCGQKGHVASICKQEYEKMQSNPDETMEIINQVRDDLLGEIRNVRSKEGGTHIQSTPVREDGIPINLEETPNASPVRNIQPSGMVWADLIPTNLEIPEGFPTLPNTDPIGKCQKTTTIIPTASNVTISCPNPATRVSRHESPSTSGLSKIRDSSNSKHRSPSTSSRSSSIPRAKQQNNVTISNVNSNLDNSMETEDQRGRSTSNKKRNRSSGKGVSRIDKQESGKGFSKNQGNEGVEISPNSEDGRNSKSTKYDSTEKPSDQAKSSLYRLVEWAKGPSNESGTS